MHNEKCIINNKGNFNSIIRLLYEWRKGSLKLNNKGNNYVKIQFTLII